MEAEEESAYEGYLKFSISVYTGLGIYFGNSNSPIFTVARRIKNEWKEGVRKIEEGLDEFWIEILKHTITWNNWSCWNETKLISIGQSVYYLRSVHNWLSRVETMQSKKIYWIMFSRKKKLRKWWRIAIFLDIWLWNIEYSGLWLICFVFSTIHWLKEDLKRLSLN